MSSREPARVSADRPGEDTVVGAARVGAEGAIGGPAAKLLKVRRATLGGRGGGLLAVAREYDPEQAARTAGVLGLVADGAGLGGVASAYAVGDGDADVWGGLTGAEIGEQYGIGGLGLVGTGRGGPLSGEGPIGLDRAGLIGKGGCGCGNGSAYARGAGTGFGGRTSRTPKVHQARADVQGGLDEAAVRRVVRAHLSELRHCYDQALARDPQAKGRLALEFLIGDAGQVSHAVVGESDVRDPALGAAWSRRCGAGGSRSRRAAGGRW